MCLCTAVLATINRATKGLVHPLVPLVNASTATFESHSCDGFKRLSLPSNQWPRLLLFVGAEQTNRTEAHEDCRLASLGSSSTRRDLATAWHDNRATPHVKRVAHVVRL